MKRGERDTSKKLLSRDSTLMRTSFFCGGATDTLTIWSGCFGAKAIAALHSIGNPAMFISRDFLAVIETAKGKRRSMKIAIHSFLFRLSSGLLDLSTEGERRRANAAQSSRAFGAARKGGNEECEVTKRKQYNA